MMFCQNKTSDKFNCPNLQVRGVGLQMGLDFGGAAVQVGAVEPEPAEVGEKTVYVMKTTVLGGVTTAPPLTLPPVIPAAAKTIIMREAAAGGSTKLSWAMWLGVAASIMAILASVAKLTEPCRNKAALARKEAAEAAAKEQEPPLPLPPVVVEMLQQDPLTMPDPIDVPAVIPTWKRKTMKRLVPIVEEERRLAEKLTEDFGALFDAPEEPEEESSEDDEPMPQPLPSAQRKRAVLGISKKKEIGTSKVFEEEEVEPLPAVTDHHETLGENPPHMKQLWRLKSSRGESWRGLDGGVEDSMSDPRPKPRGQDSMGHQDENPGLCGGYGPSPPDICGGEDDDWDDEPSRPKRKTEISTRGGSYRERAVLTRSASMFGAEGSHQMPDEEVLSGAGEDCHDMIDMIVVERRGHRHDRGGKEGWDSSPG